MSEQVHNSDWLSVDQAAVVAGISSPTIFRWLRSGKLTRYKSRGKTVIWEEELYQLLLPKARDSLSMRSLVEKPDISCLEKPEQTNSVIEKPAASTRNDHE